MVWTNARYLNLIEDYRKCRVLWDARNPDYTNNNKKRKYFVDLAQKYGMDESSLKKKIKNLRSAFHREHHRLTNKIKGEEHEADGIRKWFAYDALKFILDVAGPLVDKEFKQFLRSKADLKEAESHNEPARFEHRELPPRKAMVTTCPPSRINIKREGESFSTEDSFQDDFEDDQEFDISTQYIQLPELMPEPDGSKSPENSKENVVTKEEDEFDLFGRSMTMQLKKMPELVALDLMQKMQLMVFNAKKQLSRAKNKRKLKLAKPVSHQVQFKIASKKKIRSPSPMSHMSSPSTSPNYKFEAISPDTASVGDKGPDFYEYVAAVEPYNEETNEDTESNVILKQLKRKNLKSIDPLEVKQCKVSSARIKSE